MELKSVSTAHLRKRFKEILFNVALRSFHGIPPSWGIKFDLFMRWSFAGRHSQKPLVPPFPFML